MIGQDPLTKNRPITQELGKGEMSAGLCNSFPETLFKCH